MFDRILTMLIVVTEAKVCNSVHCGEELWFVYFELKVYDLPNEDLGRKGCSRCVRKASILKVSGKTSFLSRY